MGSLAASGGYYISVPCRWIEANQLTLTGSIGVIMEGLNYRGLMDKVGLAPIVYKSGKYKDMLSGMRETNEIPAGEHAMVQGLIDETYGIFTNVVSTGRAAGPFEKRQRRQGACRRLDELRRRPRAVRQTGARSSVLWTSSAISTTR